MEFKAQTKAGTLLDWLRAIHAVTDDCILTTSELDVVEVRAVDPANALMIVMRMPDHAWDVLEVEADGIGIDVEKMIAKVEMFDPDADITITSDHRELRDWFIITDGSATFGLVLPDPAKMRKPPAEPRLGDLPAQFIVSAERLQRAVTRAESVGDNVWIGMNSDGCVRVWTATDYDDYEEPLQTARVGVLVPVAVRSMFSLDYMRDIVAAMCGEVLVHLGLDKSVRMSFTLHDASVTYIQAPRVE